MKTNTKPQTKREKKIEILTNAGWEKLGTDYSGAWFSKGSKYLLIDNSGQEREPSILELISEGLFDFAPENNKVLFLELILKINDLARENDKLNDRVRELEGFEKYY